MIRRGIGVQSFVAAGGFDADAQAVITAIESTGVTLTATQKTACNTLVTDLKGYGIWTKMKAVYGFLGGTAGAHKWNWKNPADTDAAFRLVFNGGWTHSSNGALPNGTNGFADTKLNPSGLIDANNISLSIYSRTNSDGVKCDIGAETNASSSTYQYSIYSRLSNILYTDLGSQVAGRITYANTNSQGLFTSTRTSSTSFKALKNGTVQATLTTTQSQTILSRILYLSAMNNNFFGAQQLSDRQLAFASIGDGLTDTEAANLYTAVQAYQTTLSRNV